MEDRTTLRLSAGVVTMLVVSFVLLMGGRLGAGQYWTCVILLCASLGAVKVSSKGKGTLFERFGDEMGSIPWLAYDALAPSLERLAATVRGDAGDRDTASTSLTSAMYAGRTDADLHDDTGKVDEIKFAVMKLEYKRIATLLCRMQALAPDAHDTLVATLGGCVIASR